MGIGRRGEGGKVDPLPSRCLEHKAPGVSGSNLEGIDKILTATRLGLPTELRRSLACTNIIENMNSTICRVYHDVKGW
jgi:hypothetical protein